ncbi:hypothetical protein [Citreimonas sp.]|uniref:hypothetical protein n=1 Tax=Citreimonas sp. TaxID=3036715 RepID=UPI00405945E1
MTFKVIIKSIAIAAALAVALVPASAGAVQSGGLPQPEGPVVVTISGAVTHTNNADGAAFDLAMLEALTGREAVVETPWYDGVQRFSGPTLKALLDAVGATGDTLRVIALNDYSADIPVSDAESYPVILATRRNGDVMSVRDKGPAFVIYPFDLVPELYNEMIFHRSVWQVTRIEVE